MSFVLGQYGPHWYEARVGKPDDYPLDPKPPVLVKWVRIDFATGEIVTAKTSLEGSSNGRMVDFESTDIGSMPIPSTKIERTPHE